WYHATYDDDPSIPELTEAELREYKEHLRARNLKPATVNLALAALRSLLKWAHDRRLLPEPLRTPKTVRQSQKTPRWLSKPQERRLLKVVRHGGNKHHLGLVEVFLVFGLRISELAALEWGDVTMGRTEAELRVRRGKGAKERTLPFTGNDRARDAFR